MNRIKAAGLAMVSMSALIFLIYPTATLNSMLILALMWILALLGGTIAAYGAFVELNDKHKENKP